MTLISKHIEAYKGIEENKCCSVLLAIENVLAFLSLMIASIQFVIFIFGAFEKSTNSSIDL